MTSKWPFNASIDGLVQQVQLVCSTGKKTYLWSREFTFHPTRQWRADIVIHAPKIICEYQGGLYLGRKGGHQTASGARNDWEKSNEAQMLGYFFLQFGPDEVRTGDAMNTIKRAIEVRTRP